eukprot:1176501-Prorocentrum_minimum.AAC.6
MPIATNATVSPDGCPNCNAWKEHHTLGSVVCADGYRRRNFRSLDRYPFWTPLVKFCIKFCNYCETTSGTIDAYVPYPFLPRIACVTCATTATAGKK